MSTLTNKRVLLGVTGGIAAYKSADLIRRLQDAGADVRVVMTANAKEFITPLTLQALSGKPVHSELLDSEAEAAMGHIELARWADIILVAPASADFLAKLNAGDGSNLLLTLCLAARCELAIAPAMNQAMWAATSTQENLDNLKRKGVHVIGPASGIQACGDVGLGRMLEPTLICEHVQTLFEHGTLAGKTVMITAGPTREAIDPVRYISNHSSGKMGYAIANAAIEAGAKVILVSGPVRLPSPEHANVIGIESALDMYDAVHNNIKNVDIFIGAAAVADYRPAKPANEKLKKIHGDINNIELIENPDIIASVTALENRPFTVGFAAETNDVLEYAKGKLERKKLDIVIANDVSDNSIGFNSDENAVCVLSTNQDDITIDQASKSVLARKLVQLIAASYTQK